MEYDQNELLQATELYPSLWMVQNEIKTSSGFPFEFDNHLFMQDIVDDMSPLQVGLKPPQIGWSETLMVKTFYMAAKKEKDIIFTLPTATDRDDMVGSKVNRIIAQNPILQKMVKDHDTIEQKVVGSHIIHYRGTFSAKSAMMVSSDLNVHDETDSSDPEVLTQYENRLEAKANGMRWYFSHPSLSGHGVDVYWQMSNKREWFITCPTCKGEQVLTWPENIDMERKVYICSVCKEELTDKTRKLGVWKPTAEGKFSGYHISQMMCSWISAEKIIDAFHDPLKDKQFFYNYVLGLPYIGSEDRIEPKTVLMNCVDVPNDYYDVKDRVIIGCDTGLGIHYTLMNSQGVFLYGEETEITATKSPYDKIKSFLRTFEHSIAMLDKGGELQGSVQLRAEFPGRVFLCTYQKDKKSMDYVEWGTDDNFGIVKIDRNRQMTLLVEQMRDIGRFRLNGTKEEWKEWADMFANIYREKIEVDSKPGKDDKTLYGNEWVWKRNGPDHWVHSLLYAMVGMQHFQGTEAKIFGGKSVMDGIRKAQIVSDGGVQLIWPK